MPWLRLPDGRQRFVRPGSQTEARWLRRGAKPVEHSDHVHAEPAGNGEDGEDVANMTVRMLLDSASDADLDTIERLLREEYIGANRKTALEGLKRLRAQRQE